MRNVKLFNNEVTLRLAQLSLANNLLRSRLSGCHATLLLSGERCVTSRKTAAKETNSQTIQTKSK